MKEQMENNIGLSISEASQQLDVPPHTIRYWEREFGEFLRPQRSQGGQRKYSDFDLLLLKRIKRMLREDKYSIAGAKQKLHGLLLNEKEIDKQDLLLKLMDFIKSNNLATF